jgi:hypothetical protein
MQKVSEEWKRKRDENRRKPRRRVHTRYALGSRNPKERRHFFAERWGVVLGPEALPRRSSPLPRNKGNGLDFRAVDLEDDSWSYGAVSFVCETFVG